MLSVTRVVVLEGALSSYHRRAHMRIPVFLLVGATVVLLSPVAAEAQDVDAREEFLRGQTAYQQGDFQRAIEAWQRAYEADPRPLLLYNLARAHERLGHVREALDALDLYLDRASPNDEHQSNARALSASLRERLAATAFVVVGAPDGATILVDGEPHSRTPRVDPIRVDPGSHQIELRHDDYAPFQAAVVVPAGETVEVRATMEARGGGGVELTPVAAVDREESPSVLPFVLLGGGGAAIAVGAVLGVIALGAADDPEQFDSARGLALGADILFGVGVVAAAVGLVLLLTDDGETERAPTLVRLHLAPAVGPTSGGAMLGGAF